jgi:hypothetical protein
MVYPSIPNAVHQHFSWYPDSHHNIILFLLDPSRLLLLPNVSVSTESFKVAFRDALLAERDRCVGFENTLSSPIAFVLATHADCLLFEVRWDAL